MKAIYGRKLTKRESAVVQAILNGHTSNELIAAHLGISVRTVSAFLNRIFAKVGARDRTHLVLLMRDGVRPQVQSLAIQSVTATAHRLWQELDGCQLERLAELLTMRLRSMDRSRINE